MPQNIAHLNYWNVRQIYSCRSAELEASANANGLTISDLPVNLHGSTLSLVYSQLFLIYTCVLFSEPTFFRMHRVARSRQTDAAVYIGTSL